jgi:hypothetical protein
LRFYGTPPNSAAGNYTVTIRAYDDFGGESFYPFNVEIKYNNPPSITVSYFYEI